MTLERLTDLRSTNPPRPGTDIRPGDVVRIERKRDDMTEERAVPVEVIVQDDYPPLTDYCGRPVCMAYGESGPPWYPLQADCVRVDPAPQPEDTSSPRPFEDRKEH